VAWNPTRSILASCASDKAVRLYSYQLSTPGSDETDSNTSTRAPEVTFRFLTEINTAHKRTIRSIAWSPNGKTLATASFDSTVGIWEEVDEYAGVEGVETFGTEDEPDVSGEKEWECITTLEGHESECKSVGWSADGMLLASCSRDKSVWVWEREYLF
jgi:WD40 repeat protein